MLDELLESGNEIQNIDDALHSLPGRLSDTYTRMLHDYSVRSGTPQELQLLVLQCLTHSSRPLRLLKLSTITDFVWKTSQPQLVKLANKSLQDTKSVIRSGCGP